MRGASRDSSRDYVDADGRVRLVDVSGDFPTGFAAAMRRAGTSDDGENRPQGESRAADPLELARALRTNPRDDTQSTAGDDEDVRRAASVSGANRPSMPRALRTRGDVPTQGVEAQALLRRRGSHGSGHSGERANERSSGHSGQHVGERGAQHVSKHGAEHDQRTKRLIEPARMPEQSQKPLPKRRDLRKQRQRPLDESEPRRSPKHASLTAKRGKAEVEPRAANTSRAKRSEERAGRHRKSPIRLSAPSTASAVSSPSPVTAARWQLPLEDDMQTHNVDVLVIGAGQAGISAAYELQRRGFVGYAGPAPAPDYTDRVHLNGAQNANADGPTRGTFIVLDQESGPGGAWQHRWDGLTMETVNGIADLPHMPVGAYDPHERANEFVPQYFANFEHEFDLPILRPVKVRAVHKRAEYFEAETTAGVWRAKFVVNCTGTWTRPFVPYYPGAETFKGAQYHSKDFPGAQKLWEKRVLVVGGGISATDHIREIYKDVKALRWVTRTPPRWRGRQHERGLTNEAGREIEAKVRERVEQGLAPLPVVAVTGLPLTDALQALRDQGVLDRKPMFDRIDATGVWWGDHHEKFDVIIWATGFRAEQQHLRPLGLRSSRGGIVIEGTHAKEEPHLHLLGYGPSASTVGARRDARVVVRQIIRDMANGS
ncbi:MAG: NAD(P)-binding domain-containing protein [Actinomycetaceae bacterium]|nr:NAD(P)-binding domain-containing protein [Actinomycetaceae bacterium]MDY6143459.1 NAD(P)-binding domain-containing protein [Arcanobacterium sp.]